MRKYFVLALLTLLLVAGTAFSVEDDFHITVTVDFLEIFLRDADCTGDYGTWAFGQHAAGFGDTMTTTPIGSHICVDNGNNCATDFSVGRSLARGPPVRQRLDGHTRAFRHLRRGQQDCAFLCSVGTLQGKQFLSDFLCETSGNERDEVLRIGHDRISFSRMISLPGIVMARP